VLVNLDPANDNLIYAADIDIREIIRIQDIMDKQHLGPNAALLFCIEELERRIDWLIRRLAGFAGGYFIFDLPGQVELTTCHGSLLSILQHLEKNMFRVWQVNDLSFLADCRASL